MRSLSARTSVRCTTWSSTRSARSPSTASALFAGSDQGGLPALGRDCLPDRNLQAQRHRSPGLLGQHPHPADQPPPRQPDRPAHALGICPSQPCGLRTALTSLGLLGTAELTDGPPRVGSAPQRCRRGEPARTAPLSATACPPTARRPPSTTASIAGPGAGRGSGCWRRWWRPAASARASPSTASTSRRTARQRAERGARAQAVGPSRGGRTTKLHLINDLHFQALDTNKAELEIGEATTVTRIGTCTRWKLWDEPRRSPCSRYRKETT
jgi:hypothetical protein